MTKEDRKALEGLIIRLAQLEQALDLTMLEAKLKDKHDKLPRDRRSLPDGYPALQAPKQERHGV